jgi:thioredoxin reductase (NADPH)
MKSSVKRIDIESVSIEKDDGISKVRNDAVIVSAGGVLPSEFLKRVGITVETKHGTE